MAMTTSGDGNVARCFHEGDRSICGADRASVFIANGVNQFNSTIIIPLHHFYLPPGRQSAVPSGASYTSNVDTIAVILLL